MFKSIQFLYKRGIITADAVKKYVARGLLTVGEYQVITGEEYKSEA